MFIFGRVYRFQRMETDMQIGVGTSWKDAKGRIWEVFERMPFGMFRVRTADLSRIGEMSGRAIAAHLSNAA